MVEVRVILLLVAATADVVKAQPGGVIEVDPPLPRCTNPGSLYGPFLDVKTTADDARRVVTSADINYFLTVWVVRQKLGSFFSRFSKNSFGRNFFKILFKFIMRKFIEFLLRWNGRTNPID